MSQTLTVAPWRTFAVEVRALHRLSPSFLRVTFTGADLDRFADNGYDQRIKLALPLSGDDVVYLPGGPDWYQQWRALPNERRNPIRTYTVRAVRPRRFEVDVDLVLHGDGGPASRWARRARASVIGSPSLGPDAGYDGDHGGVEFKPPRSGPLLLAGDETATPAICAILERLPDDAHGQALLEIPDPADALPVAAPPGMAVSWLPRGAGQHGSRLVPAVTAATDTLAPRIVPAPTVLADVDVDHGILWETPTAAPAGTSLYAWLAGEAGVIRRLRRHLVADRGLDRRSIAFMGYWRLGRTDNA